MIDIDSHYAHPPPPPHRRGTDRGYQGKFSPETIESYVFDSYTALAMSEGKTAEAVPQMAAALLAHYRSAGSQPGAEINPVVADKVNARVCGLWEEIQR